VAATLKALADEGAIPPATVTQAMQRYGIAADKPDPAAVRTTGACHNAGMRTFLLYAATAIAEIVGCYLPYLWLREGRSAWLLVPAAASLALFAWLLTLHPTAAGRVYAAYGASTSAPPSYGCGPWTAYGPRRGTWRARPWRWPAWASSSSSPAEPPGSPYIPDA